MKKIYLLFLLINFSTQLFGQQIHFAKSYFSSGFYDLRDFVELKDSGFIIVGSFKSSPPASEYNFLLRLNKYGDTIFSRQYLSVPGRIGSVASYNDTTVIVTNGFFNLYGYFINTMLINVLTGDTFNYRQYGYQSPGFSGGIIKCKDNGYAFLNIQGLDYSILKIDSIGNEKWHKSSNMYFMDNLKADISTGLIIIGTNGQSFQPYNVLSLDDSGNVRWQRNYGINPNYDQYYALGIVNTADSNYLVSCDGMDWHLMKLNRFNGDTIWTKITNSVVGISSLVPAGNDRYLGLGWQKLYLFDGNGDTIWTKDYAWPLSNFWPYVLKNTSDGGFAYSGFYCPTGSSGYKLPAFVKTDSLGNTVFAAVIDSEMDNPLKLYPNPTNTELYINTSTFTAEKNLTITLTNMQGKIILQQEFDKAKAVDVSSLPNGIYVAEVRGKEKVVRGKVVVQR